MEFREALLAIRPEVDVELIGRAYDIAARCHQGQKRRSGDPYITHPVAVTMILAGLGIADDQMLCAAMLHDTVEDTPYTLPELRHDFGPAIATMVVGLTALDPLRGWPDYEVRQVMATIESADTRVVTMMLADRLHNMQTVQFLPQAKQLRKARETIDVFHPVARQLGMYTVSTELRTLACATLIRNRPAGPPRLRAIVALDIEQSTTRPDPVKAEFRIMLYEFFEAALRSAGIGPDRRDPFVDRGDGLLALVDPAELAPLFSRVVPVFAQLLTGYNASLPPRRQFRVRVVVHAGQVRRDDNGCFGEALDIACRLLDAPEAKAALKAAPDPLLLIISSHIRDSIAGHAATARKHYRHLVTTHVAGCDYRGWSPVLSLG
ncbi:MAG TPA: HD domain-containing protein [Streptosporangiaceae bacterium]|nr:HD domain-containing protein [Streptosporangiaceae bacterium]